MNASQIRQSQVSPAEASNESEAKNIVRQYPGVSGLKSIAGVILGAFLGILCSVILALPFKLLSDTVWGFVLPSSTGTTDSYFECAVIGCFLAAVLMWILATLYGAKSKVLLTVTAGAGLVVALVGGYGGARIADMVAWGAAEQYYTVGGLIGLIPGNFDIGEIGTGIAGGFQTAFESEGDAVYEYLASELMPAAFFWISVICLGLIGVAGAMRFVDGERPHCNRQADLSILGALAGYLTVEWHTGGDTVACWCGFGLILGVCVRYLRRHQNPKRRLVRRISLVCLVSGFGFDLLDGDESLLWKATIAASVWLSAWIVSAATIDGAILDPRALLRTTDKPSTSEPPPIPDSAMQLNQP